MCELFNFSNILCLLGSDVLNVCSLNVYLSKEPSHLRQFQKLQSGHAISALLGRVGCPVVWLLWENLFTPRSPLGRREE